MKSKYREKAEPFIDFLHDGTTNIENYPYDEITHGFAIGVLYAKMMSLMHLANSGAFYNGLDYWSKINANVLSLYKKANSKISTDDIVMNKLVGYVFSGFTEMDSDAKKASVEVQQAILFGASIANEALSATEKTPVKMEEK